MSIYNSLAGKRLNRIEGLSDGVFSIAMTLLVFNLKDPLTGAVQSDKELWLALQSILPALLSFFLSFMTLGIFWTGHSTQFQFIERSDRNLNWISILFLMFVSLVPFSTSILAGHINNRLSIGIYWLNIFFLGAFLYFHWLYARRKNLLSEKENNLVLIDKGIRNRIITAQCLYAAAALLCFWSVYISIGAIILIQLNYAFGIINRKTTK